MCVLANGNGKSLPEIQEELYRLKNASGRGWTSFRIRWSARKRLRELEQVIAVQYREREVSSRERFETGRKKQSEFFLTDYGKRLQRSWQDIFRS